MNHLRLLQIIAKLLPVPKRLQDQTMPTQDQLDALCEAVHDAKLKAVVARANVTDLQAAVAAAAQAADEAEADHVTAQTTLRNAFVLP